MFKKVFVAALAVVVGGGFLMFGTRAISHVRLAIKEARTAARAKVSPEREVARLRMELERDKGKDRAAIDRIARLTVEVGNLQNEVNEKKSNLAKLDREMKTWETALSNDGTTLQVTFNDRTKDYSRVQVEEQLRRDARVFLNLKNSLEGQEALLKIKQETLSANKKALADRQTLREKNLAKLQQIENALLRERLKREQQGIVSEDGRESPVFQDIKALDNRVRTMAEESQILSNGGTDEGPIRGDAIKSKPDTEVDTFLKARRGPANVVNR